MSSGGKRLYVGGGLPRDIKVRLLPPRRARAGARGVWPPRSGGGGSRRSPQQRQRPPHPHAPPRPPRPSLAQDDQLEDHFVKFGKLTSIWIARNPPGFAYVVSAAA